MCAIASQNPAMVARLIQSGAIINTANHTGKTPLVKASELSNLTIVEMLLESGANPKDRDQGGKNAQWYGEKMGHLDIARHLNCTLGKRVQYYLSAIDTGLNQHE